MADRFHREVSDMHQLWKDIRSLPLAKAEEFMERLGDDAADDWVFRARDAQLPPPDLDWCWLFLGGRGTGKSHSMSAAVHVAVRGGIKRIQSNRSDDGRLPRRQSRRRERHPRDLRPRSTPALGIVEATAGMAERRDLRVLLGRRAGIIARPAMRIVRDR